MSFYVGCYKKEWARFRVYLPTSDNPSKNIFSQECLAALAWFDSICSQVDRQDKASWEGIIYLDPVSEDSFSPRCLGRLSQMQ